MMYQSLIDGSKYFVIIVDDFSRMTWLFFLKHKAIAYASIKEFLMYVKTHFGKRVKIVRYDNGTEFVNSLCYYVQRYESYTSNIMSLYSSAKCYC